MLVLIMVDHSGLFNKSSNVVKWCKSFLTLFLLITSFLLHIVQHHIVSSCIASQCTTLFIRYRTVLHQKQKYISENLLLPRVFVHVRGQLSSGAQDKDNKNCQEPRSCLEGQISVEGNQSKIPTRTCWLSPPLCSRNLDLQC